MRQHKVFLRHELLKYNSEKSTAKSSALENYISSANLSLSGCSSAEPNSVSVGRCKFQLKKLYLQTVKKVDHLPDNFNIGDISKNKGQINVGKNITANEKGDDEISKKAYRWQKRDSIITITLSIIGLIIADFSMNK